MSEFQWKTSQEQQAEAWKSICKVFDEVYPDWLPGLYTKYQN